MKTLLTLFFKFVVLFEDGKLKAKELIGFSLLLFSKIKDYLIKVVLVKLLASIPAWLSGPVSWVATLAISLLVDKTLKPLFNLTVLKVWTYFKALKFRKEGRDLEASKTEDEFDTNFDNMS